MSQFTAWATGLCPDVPIVQKIVVIVEDAETLAHSLATVLETLPGVKTVVTRDPRTALALFGAPDSAISALVTDLNLPYVDGFELIQQIRTMAAYTKLPVIMISADERATALNGSAPHPANALFRKPFSLKEVRRVLEELLE